MVIPSVDLMGAKAVQLRQGKEKMLEKDNPVALANEFNKFSEVAIVDLDAVFSRDSNINIIKEICKTADCRVGGGIKSIDKAKEILNAGAKKVIVSSKVFEEDKINYEFLKLLQTKIGKERVIIAIDSIGEEIVTKGWKHFTGLNIFDTVKQIEGYCREFLYTCVEKEGTMEGIEMNMANKLRETTKNRITAAGGIKSLGEIEKLSELNVNAQLGMALYTCKINLIDAFISSIRFKDDLVPTIVQDVKGQVLMMAYSNRESLKRTFESNQANYYSRSRQKLWKKGETSGNIQFFVKARTDCDNDTILFTVRQKGASCHTGTYSCFGDKEFTLEDLYEVIKDRLDHPVPDSYTASLTEEKLKDKIMEEAQELIEASGEAGISWEAADLFYFATVLLAKNNLTLKDVLRMLESRRRK